jgi:hypothetical protein
MTFYSKKSWGLGLLLFVPVIGTLVSTWMEKGFMTALLPLVILIIVSLLWFNTKYTIQEGKVITWAGFIPYPKVQIADILKIKPTNSWLSAPACSLDRILLQYGKYDYLIISPKDKKGFINALLAEKPAIEVDDTLKPLVESTS